MNKADINESIVAVLKNDTLTKTIILDHVEIENHFVKESSDLEALASDASSSLEDIALFLSKTQRLLQLNGTHRYCRYIGSAYQRFGVDIATTAGGIQKRKEIMLLNKKNSPDTYNLEEKINNYKLELLSDFLFWIKAYNISKTYKQCNDAKDVLTFSHRIDGWANPVYKLNNNFSIELKTNFGFGGASYFYTIIKYKNIEITPFSEWIEYEFAKFSEIVRYSQTYLLVNSEWLEALTYAMEACNLSMYSEEAFVKKYIIEECDSMVKGLKIYLTKRIFRLRKETNLLTKLIKKDTL